MADPDTVWIISKGVVAGDIAKGRLTPLRIDMTPTCGAVGIMSRAEEVPSVGNRMFSKLLSELIETDKLNGIVIS